MFGVCSKSLTQLTLFLYHLPDVVKFVLQVAQGQYGNHKVGNSLQNVFIYILNFSILLLTDSQAM